MYLSDVPCTEVEEVCKKLKSRITWISERWTDWLIIWLRDWWNDWLNHWLKIYWLSICSSFRAYILPVNLCNNVMSSNLLCCFSTRTLRKLYQRNCELTKKVLILHYNISLHEMQRNTAADAIDNCVFKYSGYSALIKWGYTPLIHPRLIATIQRLYVTRWQLIIAMSWNQKYCH